MATARDETQRVLGLDVGSNSVGWALVEVGSPGEEGRIVNLGSRIFPAGMEGSIQLGKEESRNKKRRDARLLRRGAWRRKRRRQKIYRLLATNGLLPEVDPADPEALHDALADLDRSLTEKFVAPGDHRSHQLLPYILRAAALDQPLEPYELGRALYHLAQRRGFLSNRKSKAREDVGTVKRGISALEAELDESGSRTLGAHFAASSPAERRVRCRYTHRSMFEREFHQICDAQAPYHEVLRPELRHQLERALFFQRPLRSQKHLIGSCDLERGRRRASMACFEFQRFRLLQAVNNLEWWPHGGDPRALSKEDRCTLIEELEQRGDLTFARTRKLLGFSSREGRFNLEEGGEKRLCGNRTNAKLREVFGDRWEQFSQDERIKVVHDLMSIQQSRALQKRGESAWGLSPELAKDLSVIVLEQDYASHSLEAIRRLLPHLEAGLTYGEARRKEYPEAFETSTALDRLPPVIEALPDVRNPTVVRSLTELRKVVNALISRYGLPDSIHVELARDIKQSKRRREQRWKQMRSRQKQREAASQRILTEVGIASPTARDIEKLLLAEQCRWVCPYTGRSFGMHDLFGESPTIDVEHILPFSRCLDNSLLNKTLCDAQENRRRKGNRTPYEAYSGDQERYAEILERVKHFEGDPFVRRQMLERFRRQTLGGDLIEAFSERQLADTRYASRSAADYVGLLFGGRSDASGKRRVHVSAGQATAILRRAWGVNALLGTGDGKSRNDHRHHALDALVIALITPAQVKTIARAAERAVAERGGRLFEGIPLPWPLFRLDARKAVEDCVTSHRMRRLLRGPLHNESLYSPPMPNRDTSGEVKVRHALRKPLGSLKSSEVSKIVDPAVRAAVQRALEFAGLASPKTPSPKDLFTDPAKHPVLEGRPGSRTPIHKVRVWQRVTPVCIGAGSRRRYVAPNSNHHMAIYEQLDTNGSVKRWRGEIVTLLEATERHRRGEPVVRSESSDESRLVFSVSAGDSLARRRDDGNYEVLHVTAVSAGVIEALAANDARSTTEVRKAGAAGGRIQMAPETVRQKGYRKAIVDTLGGVAWAND